MQEIINIKNLKKKYKSMQTNAVDDITFSVYKGELFAFLGVNGAGKSTTINILCTLLEKTAGNVSLCGYDIETSIDEIKKNIGVVFQGGILDEKLSVYDNLMIRGALFGISKEVLKGRIERLSERLSMSEFLGRQYGKLSGGQKRKSDIARALITNPKILFLDEPTTGLDPQSRASLWQVIKEIRAEFETTIFLTTHYMEEVNGADRVAIIDSGKILCIDTPQKLKTDYSHDTVKLTVKENQMEQVQDVLKSENLEFDFAVDTFSINIKSGLVLAELILKLKPKLDSVEIIKGDMDSVFLNVVGRRFYNE